MDTELYRPPPEPRREPATTVECPVALSAWQVLTRPSRGVSHLLEAIAKVAAERPVELTLVSKLDPAGPSARLIEQLSIGSSVRVVNGLDDEGARRLARQCPDRRRAVAVRGLLIAGRRGDERYAADRDACRGDPEVVGEGEDAGAVLVPPRDSGRSPRRSCDFDDEEARTALGAAARKRVEENYSWAAVAAKTVAAYQRAIDQNAAATAEEDQ